MMISFIAPPAIARPVEDVQLWTTIGLSGPIKGNILFAGDVQSRITNNLGRYGQTVARAAVGIKATPKLSFFTGYVYSEIEPPNAVNSSEDRLFQQASWTIGPTLGGTLSSRTRLEQRWFRGSRDLGVRLRQQLRLAVPLTEKGIQMFGASEIFFHLNSTDWGARAGLDQLRGQAGLSLPISRSINAEISYQPIYIKGATVDRFNHTIPVTLVVKF